MSRRFQAIAAMPPEMRQAAARAALKAGRIAATPEQIEKGDAKRSKYRNTPTSIDGIRFDSKREARLYEQLKLQREAGSVDYFLRQVPIHLPDGTRYVCDFLVFYPDKSHRYLDAKGHKTAVFKLKKRGVEHHYPIEIECV